MNDPLGLALVGCGTVGTGVCQLLVENPARLAARGGRALVLRSVAVRDAGKPRDPVVPANLISTDPFAALADPMVDVVVELIGGTTTAKEVVLAALAAGKHVVTANKALLAAHGPAVFAAARRAGVCIGFEAAVAGGIPIIKALLEGLAGNQVTAIQGIMNGTSNFILSAMADRGITYDQALAEAQILGYAEADPTLDVDGSDAAHKLAILAQIAFGVTPAPSDIERHGIAGLDAADIRFADELGYTIKLLAEAWSDGPQVALHVAPVLLRKTDMLAQVRGAQNAVLAVGDAVGEVLFQGPGAGMRPTASAVVADLIDLATGRLPATFAAANLWADRPAAFAVAPAERVRSRFYLRLVAKDKPGVLADVCRALADAGISIASVVQHEAVEGQPERAVPLVIMTHYAETGAFRTAAANIARLTGVAAGPVYYSVDD